jgi:hypothetical protein
MKTFTILRILFITIGLAWIAMFLLMVLSIPVPVIPFIALTAAEFIIGIVGYMVRDREAAKKKENSLDRRHAVIATLATIALIIGTHPVLACSLVGPIPRWSCLTVPVELGFLVFSWYSCMIVWIYIPVGSDCGGYMAIDTLFFSSGVKW